MPTRPVQAHYALADAYYFGARAIRSCYNGSMPILGKRSSTHATRELGFHSALLRH